MVALKTLAGVLCTCLQVAAKDILPDEFDLSDGLSLLQLRSQRTSPEFQEDGEHSSSQMDLQFVAEDKKCKATPDKRGTFATAQACAAAWSGQGVKFIGFWEKENKNPQLKGLCLGWTDRAKCKKNRKKIHKNNQNKFFKCVEQQDEAAAVGDPHLTLTDGSTSDMCCADGPCTACDLSSLLQEEYGDSETSKAVVLKQKAKNKKCNSTPNKRGTFASAQACLAAWQGQGVSFISFWGSRNNANPQLKGLCFGWAADKCKNKVKIHKKNKNTFYKCVEEEVQDEAAAVGDPHMTLADGSTQDMCCEDGPCHACDLSGVEALIQEESQGEVLRQKAKNKKCNSTPNKRATFASAEACADAWAGQGIKFVAFWGSRNNANPQLKGLCFGWAADKCKNKVKIHKKNKNTFYKLVNEQEDEAAAVGDPHLTLTDGSTQDMCCDNGPCRACDLSHTDALVQESVGVVISKIHNNRRCPGEGKRGKFDSPQACADAFAAQGMKFIAFWTKQNKKSLQKTCIGWTADQCTETDLHKIHKQNKNRMYRCGDDDDNAEAVGDPHMTQSNDAKQDLCCDGGHCQPCQ